MAYRTLPLLAGVFKDETPLSAKGFYVDSQWCRPHRKKMEVMGGYEKASTDSVQGICRGQHSWCDDGGLCYGALGTHTYLQAYHDGELYDITPYDPANPYGRLTNPFSTTATSYSWYVWLQSRDGQQFTAYDWIAPCRKRLERAEDYHG